MNKQEAIKQLKDCIKEIKSDLSSEANIITIIIQNDRNLKPKLDIQVTDPNYVLSESDVSCTEDEEVGE